MTHRITPLIVCFLFLVLSSKAQTKMIGECALQYSITQNAHLDTLGEKWVYVKGNQCKTILHTSQLVQTLVFNTELSSATITKELGANHFLQEIVYPPLTTPNLLSMKEIISDSSIKILGYNCKGVELKWSDGVVYQVWYTTEINTTVNTFELAFKDIAGLALSYTIIPVTGTPIEYLATKIDFSPIPLSQFNINKDQYQIID